MRQTEIYPVYRPVSLSDDLIWETFALFSDLAWTRVISKHLLASFIETKASFKPNGKLAQYNKIKSDSYRYIDHDLVNPGTSVDKRDKMFSTHKPFISRFIKVVHHLTVDFDRRNWQALF